jgi:hypothetical protein
VWLKHFIYYVLNFLIASTTFLLFSDKSFVLFVFLI